MLTQSCDLVLRGSTPHCSARYISLAAIRSLETVLNRSVEDIAKNHLIKFQGSLFCSDRHADRIRTFLKSLLNNNDKNHFYLEANDKAGLNARSCTFLNLSIAIRSREHYRTCLEAKKIELEQVFQSKLGWMVGNLYSRVGTPDYMPSAVNGTEFEDLVNEIIRSEIIFVPQKNFSAFKKLCSENKDDNIDALLNNAEAQNEVKAQQLAEDIANRICRPLKFDKAVKEQIKNLFLEDSKLKSLLQQPSNSS